MKADIRQLTAMVPEATGIETRLPAEHRIIVEPSYRAFDDRFGMHAEGPGGTVIVYAPGNADGPRFEYENMKP